MGTNRVIAGLFTALLAVAVTGCTANKAIEKFADRACECHDSQCATEVANEVADWVGENLNARGDKDKADEDFQRMGTCLQSKGADLTKLKAAAEAAQK